MRSRLQALREDRGLSRAALAREAEIHPSTEGLIEAGRLRPYPSQLVKLARALGLAAIDAGSLMDDVADHAADHAA